MILSNKYGFLYIHIAKTGGTSVRSALKSLQWRDPLYLPQSICSRLSHLTGHRIGAKLPRHAKAICAQEMLPREVFEKLFKFAIVRNPWDMQVSAYHHLQQEKPELLAQTPDFASFLSRRLSPEVVGRAKRGTGATLQIEYLIDLRGQMIVDYVGRYENLQADFDSVCQRLGLPPLQLPHKRKAAAREADYRRYYDEASAALVADYFRRDIEAFGYTF